MRASANTAILRVDCDKSTKKVLVFGSRYSFSTNNLSQTVWLKPMD
jgi:hypothetical protein